MSRDDARPEAGAPARVRDLDEDALLASFVPLLPRGRRTLVGPGDDGAVVAVPGGRYVVSTDVLVEDHHFRLRWSSGYDVGWRGAAQNLADAAAMGAWPVALVVALVLPGDLPAGWPADLARGLADACRPYDVGVVGGDLSSGDRVVVAVTVHGELGDGPPVLRSGARPGDVVALAGTSGRSAAGLDLLSAGRVEPGGTDDGEPALAGLVTAYLRPDPPVAAGAAAAAAGATSLIDVSDGLLRDARRVASASGVVLDLDPVEEAFHDDLAALAPAAAALAADPVTWVLTGGEDHALLATFPPGAPLPPPFRKVGRIRPARTGRAAGTVLVSGAPPPAVGLGWDHFRPGDASGPRP